MIRANPTLDDVVEDPGLLLALDLEPLALLLDEAKTCAAASINAARAVQDEVLSRYAHEVDRAFSRAGLTTGAVRQPTRCGRYELDVERFRRADGSLGAHVRLRAGPP